MNRGVRKLGSPISSRIASGTRFAASKTSRIADRRASRERAAIDAAALDVAMPLEARPGRVAALHLCADEPLRADDLLRFLEHRRRVRPRDDEDPVELAE